VRLHDSYLQFVARTERLDHETTSSAEREGDRVIPQQIHIFDSSRKARLEIRLVRISLAQRRSCLETRGCRF